MVREINTRIFQSTKNSASQDGSSQSTAQDDSQIHLDQNPMIKRKHVKDVSNENLDENERSSVCCSQSPSLKVAWTVYWAYFHRKRKRKEQESIQISSESSEFWEQVLEETSDPLATCRNILGGSGSDVHSVKPCFRICIG